MEVLFNFEQCLASVFMKGMEFFDEEITSTGEMSIEELKSRKS